MGNFFVYLRYIIYKQMSATIEKNVPLNKVSCNYCKHFIRDEKPFFHCKAFEIIPKEILSGDNKHTKPLADQKNDIAYEPEKE